jgi:drug/metabolite transporter (DMT)-like permease
MLGSLPFSIASLVTGIIALRRIRRDNLLKGEKWAVWAIVLGCLGLVFGVFLYFHFISVLQPTPPVPV